MSEAFHDMIVEFDLGDTQIFELPLYEYDQKTPRPGRWFILHVASWKDALLVEKSTGISELFNSGSYDRDVISGDKGVTIALSPDALNGADLWYDRRFKFCFFLSDRLKRAIKEGGFKIRRMPLFRCKISC